MLEQCCNYLKQCHNNVARLCCAKCHRCESSHVTSPLHHYGVVVWNSLPNHGSDNKTDKMATKYMKMGWNCDSDEENFDNHSKIPIATWPSLQYVKQPHFMPHVAPTQPQRRPLYFNLIAYLPTPRVQKSGDVKKSLHCKNVIIDNVWILSENHPKTFRMFLTSITVWENRANFLACIVQFDWLISDQLRYSLNKY